MLLPIKLSLLFKVQVLLLLLLVLLLAMGSVLPQEATPSFLGPNSRLTGRMGGRLAVDVAGIVIEVAILSTEDDGVDDDETVLSESISVVNPLLLSSCKWSDADDDDGDALRGKASSN